MLAADNPIETARQEASARTLQPKFAVDGKGTTRLMYRNGDLIDYSRSEDRGATFSKPQPLPAAHATSLGMRRGPRVAVSDSGMCITVVVGKHGSIPAAFCAQLRSSR